MASARIPDFADRVATTTFACYDRLGKNGKPQLHSNKAEWTVLASVVVLHYGKQPSHSFSFRFFFFRDFGLILGVFVVTDDNYTLEVVSLG